MVQRRYGPHRIHDAVHRSHLVKVNVVGGGRAVRQRFCGRQQGKGRGGERFDVGRKGRPFQHNHDCRKVARRAAAVVVTVIVTVIMIVPAIATMIVAAIVTMIVAAIATAPLRSRHRLGSVIPSAPDPNVRGRDATGSPLHVLRLQRPLLRHLAYRRQVVPHPGEQPRASAAGLAGGRRLETAAAFSAAHEIQEGGEKHVSGHARKCVDVEVARKMGRHGGGERRWRRQRRNRQLGG
mmetsp:Transcript_26915/g.61957  ORF Transcript_26915/g.61957 Transcript_26915/m.61957 type:complete len:237 (-) Transcript_26915:317-1027(-)